MSSIAETAAPVSTNVRSNRRPQEAPTIVRAFFRSLSAVSPALATKAATELFFRPPRAKPSARSLEVLATAGRREVSIDGRPVRYFTWHASGPAVYLLHGWGGVAAQLGSFVAPLRERGFSVVAIDAPAHGASPGRLSSIIHFSRALRAVVRAEGRAHGLVAHSLGGAAGAHAIHHGLDVGRAVFVGVPADLGIHFPAFLSKLGIPPERHAPVLAALERRFEFEWRELSPARLGPEMSVPLLLVHDEGDEEIPLEDANRIARSWPGAVVHTTEGLGHRRILRDAMVVARAADFVGAASA